jgi:hypothetical protein
VCQRSLSRQSLLPHEVADADGAAAGHALCAVHQHSTCRQAGKETGGSVASCVQVLSCRQAVCVMGRHTLLVCLLANFSTDSTSLAVHCCLLHQGMSELLTCQETQLLSISSDSRP